MNYLFSEVEPNLFIHYSSLQECLKNSWLENGWSFLILVMSAFRELFLLSNSSFVLEGLI